jgi:hypothetical protein
MEIDWLQEMMRLSGVPDEEPEEESLPFLPGMLPQSDEEEMESKRRMRFRLAEEQTLSLIDEQEALREMMSEEEE